MSDEMMRLDALLVAKGCVSGREKAKELIENGAVTVSGKIITKASVKVPCDSEITCDTTSVRFVGRGGFKLEKALAVSGVDVNGAVAMDVGASTGGFTDCLLQSGAKKVYAIDVGTDQLHPVLREDPRVVVLEGTDVRSPMLREIIPACSVDVCAIDVSFISLTRVLPAVLPFLKGGAIVLCLIKPQFEAGKSGIGKKGVVRDAKVHRRILEELCIFFNEMALSVQTLDFSPITGGEGNIEFLAALVYSNAKPCAPLPVSVKDVVEAAHKMLKR